MSRGSKQRTHTPPARPRRETPPAQPQPVAREAPKTPAPPGGRAAGKPGAPGDPRRRGQVPAPPRGWRHLVWLGPGFLWMVSAAGSGELLFTPRVAAQYGYTLLWALLAAVTLKWFVNHEIGRFAVCAGSAVLEGFSRLPGPRNWAVWLILVPQLLVAVSITAGMAASAATAVVLVLPGTTQVWMVALVALSAALVLWGRYSVVEKVATFMAISLAVAAVAGAVAVFPGAGPLVAGLAPAIPEDVNYGEILPWLGFMLAGAAGLMWYSYWLPAKGYGAAEARERSAAPLDVPAFAAEGKERLRGWLRQMTLDNTVAVAGTLLPTVAFLILGAELLRPQGLVPAEERVAETLGHLLGGIWGPAGYWFMIAGVFIGFSGTLLSLQDGFGRLFADGTRLLLRSLQLRGRWTDEVFLRRAYVLGLVTVLPVALYLIVGRPVGLLKLAGAIEAAHIPIVAGLTLWLNHRFLPADLRPSWPVFAGTVLAAIFFAAFAALYLYRLAMPVG